MKKFRGFSDFVAELGTITAILGRNSSGKTSILQAIRLACDAARQILRISDDDPQIKDGWIHVSRSDEIIADPAQLVGLVDWTQLITDGEVGDGVLSSIQLEFDTSDPISSLETRLIHGRNAQLKVWSRVQSKLIEETVAGFSSKSPQRAPRLREELDRWLPIAVFIPPFYGVIRSEEYRTDPLVRRALVQGDQSHIVRNLLARLDGLGPTNDFLRRTIGNGAEVKTWIPEALRNEHAELEVHYRDSNGQLELSTAGAGLVSLIATAAALEWTGQTVVAGQSPHRMFLFDEPEAHLHPRLQGESGLRTAEAVRRYGAQMILATHSVEMIDRLGRLSETVLLHVDRTARAGVKLTTDNEIVTALDEFCNLTPYASINFLASRRVVFHEGPSDWRILNACAEALLRQDAVKLSLWRQITPVSVDGVLNAGLSRVLERLVTPTMFPGLRDGRKLRIAVVRDRDATREPHAASVEGKTATADQVEVVWSRNSIESLFLDADVLLEWLTAYLADPAIAELSGLVEQSITAANGDADLNADARRMLVGARTSMRATLDEDTLAAVFKTAYREAERQVTQSPHIWQKGRERSRMILGVIHDRLPPLRRGGFPVDLARIIADTPADRLRNLKVAVPDEVQQLVDLMVDPL
ncbi:MAG: ATP-binding protein [Myxococcales bacterium]|nr:ATP-binding protein [Myxococcales bacterium]